MTDESPSATQCIECQTMFPIPQVEWRECPICGCATYEPVYTSAQLQPWQCQCGLINILVPANHVTVGFATVATAEPTANQPERYVFHATTECQSGTLDGLDNDSQKAE